MKPDPTPSLFPEWDTTPATPPPPPHPRNPKSTKPKPLAPTPRSPPPSPIYTPPKGLNEPLTYQDYLKIHCGNHNAASFWWDKFQNSL